jgi:hypothetical protein
MGEIAVAGDRSVLIYDKLTKSFITKTLWVVTERTADGRFVTHSGEAFSVPDTRELLDGGEAG